MQDMIETVGMLVLKGVVVPLLGLFFVWASAHLPAWIKTKVTNQRAEGILERLAQLAMAVVQETEQTIVSKLGDKADAASLLAARDQALASLKSHLGDKGLKEIEVVFGLQDQDAVIRMLITFIEQAVHNLNMAQAPETPVVAPTTVVAPTVVNPPPAA